MATSARQRIASEPAPAPPLEGRPAPLEVLPSGHPGGRGNRIGPRGRVFLLGDAVAIVACLAATAVALRVTAPTMANMFPVLAGSLVLGLYLAGCYDERVYHRANGLSTRILFGTGLSVCVSGAFLFFLLVQNQARPVVVVYHVFALLVLFLWRRTVGERICATIAPVSVAVLGYGPGVQKLGKAMARDDGYQVDVEFTLLPTGEVRVAKHGRQAGRRPATDISKVVADAGVQMIGVAPLGLAGRKDVYQQLIACRRVGVDVKDIGPCVEMLTRKLPVRHIEDWWVAFSFRFQGWGQAFDDRIKRMTDIAAASFGLLATAPLLLLVAVAIRLTSGSPVLFRQHRVGMHGRLFVMNKFRTMVADAERFGLTQTRDPRITPVGRFLRMTHLDEIPQLWNVVRGEMSLVGPRPELQGSADEYCERIPYYDLRHIVKPGITGLAQVELGYNTGVSGAEAKLEYDLHYIRHRNILWDMRILLKTMVVAATLRGSRR